MVQHDGTMQVGQKNYGSMSAAAEAITDSNRNGWQFWHLEDGRPVSDLRRLFAIQGVAGVGASVRG